jgi:hypothetical protein
LGNGPRKQIDPANGQPSKTDPDLIGPYRSFLIIDAEIE